MGFSPRRDNTLERRSPRIYGRLFKKAFNTVLKQERRKAKQPTEEVFRPLLFEIAGLLNQRPLTSPSSDPDDYHPVTPNDFLNHCSSLDPLS